MNYSDKIYKNLIENLPDAYSYQQIITDPDGKPVDFITLAVNPYFEITTGISEDEIINRPVTEAIPGFKESQFDWIGKFGEVALTGESARFTERLEALDRWLDVTAYSDKPGFFWTVFRDVTAAKKLEETLRSDRQRFSTIMNSMQDIVFTLDREQRHTGVFGSWVKNLGLKRTDFIGRTAADMMGEEAAAVHADAARKALQGEFVVYNWSVTAGDELLHYQTSLSPIYGPDGSVEELVGIGRDITAEVNISRELAQERLEKEFILQNLGQQVAFLDNDMRIIWVNPVVEKRHDLTADELKGRYCYEAYHQLNKPCSDCPVVKAISSGKQHTGVHRSPDNLYWQVTGSPVFNTEGEQIGVLEAAMDITGLVEAEKEIRHISFHDATTGLYNRAFLNAEMLRLDTERQLPLTIIMADLNGLKLINDTYGHSTGDKLLQKAALLIKDSCRTEDIVVRWGGDEFLILLPQTPENAALAICRRIIKKCRAAAIEGIPISIALGTSSKTTLNQKLTDTIKEAEDNMYRQKLTESRSNKNAVVSALLNALAAKSFETEAHTRNMQTTAHQIAAAINLSGDELSRLDLLITLHDIGKINVAEEILTKEDSLTRKEFEEVKKHPEIGFRIARATGDFAHVAEEILSHHERWDGKGYPRGLAGEKIPLLARITAIADAYEVMSNGRPYKKKLSREEIIAEFRRCSGTQFDPQLTAAFLELLLCE